MVVACYQVLTPLPQNASTRDKTELTHKTSLQTSNKIDINKGSKIKPRVFFTLISCIKLYYSN